MHILAWEDKCHGDLWFIFRADTQRLQTLPCILQDSADILLSYFFCLPVTTCLLRPYKHTHLFSLFGFPWMTLNGSRPLQLLPVILKLISKAELVANEQITEDKFFKSMRRFESPSSKCCSFCSQFKEHGMLDCGSRMLTERLPSINFEGLSFITLLQN